MTNIVHVTRIPPSPSGVSLYAQDMDAAYALIGNVVDLPLPPDPRASQSLPLAGRIWFHLRRRVRRDSPTVISVELAGRGIAEMWAAWALARSGRRVWVTVHDSPTLCGPALLTRTLDRRGLRRLGTWLSRVVGRPGERDLLGRAELVIALSPSGAEALSAAYDLDRPVLHVPHVLPRGPEPSDEHRILVPGYVGGADPVLPLVRMLRTLPSDWRLVVGAASDDANRSIAAAVEENGVSQSIQLRGFMDEESLDAEFARASIVVRWRRDGWLGGTADYAVSGPIIRAMGRSCAIITNDRRGVSDCLTAAGATVVGDGDEGEADMISAVRRLVDDPVLRRAAAATGLAHVADEHSPEAVASRLARVVR